MNSIKNLTVLCILFVISNVSQGAQKSHVSTREVTSADIEWINAEPQELVSSVVYKRWLKEFGVINAKEAKELDYTNHSIRYAYIDVTNDGRNEIVVQEGQWAARGFAFAIFEQQGKTWKTIVQHRGAFILSELDSKKPFEISLIDKDGKDYERYDLKYTKDKYTLKKRTVPYEDMSYEYFWSLNLTKAEQCKSTLRNFREPFIANELCKKSPSQLQKEHFQKCDESDIKQIKSVNCKY